MISTFREPSMVSTWLDEGHSCLSPSRMKQEQKKLGPRFSATASTPRDYGTRGETEFRVVEGVEKGLTDWRWPSTMSNQWASNHRHILRPSAQTPVAARYAPAEIRARAKAEAQVAARAATERENTEIWTADGGRRRRPRTAGASTARTRADGVLPRPVLRQNSAIDQYYTSFPSHLMATFRSSPRRPHPAVATSVFTSSNLPEGLYTKIQGKWGECNPWRFEHSLSPPHVATVAQLTLCALPLTRAGEQLIFNPWVTEAAFNPRADPPAGKAKERYERRRQQNREIATRA